MKKKVLVATVMLAMGLNSNAALQVAWNAVDGFVRSDGVTGIGTGISNGDPIYLAQLLFTPSGVVSSVLPTGTPTGDNVVLDSVIVNNVGDDYGFLPNQNYTGSFSPGFVFARVFDVGSDNTSNIDPGFFYYDSPTLAAVDESDPSIFQAFNIHSGSGPFEPGFQTDQLNLEVVPEPSVFALLGIGGLMLALRRRLRK
jgi:hypothetical protein